MPSSSTACSATSRPPAGSGAIGRALRPVDPSRGVAGLLITAFGGGLTVVNEYLTTSIDQRMVLDFRSDLFQHAQRLSLAFHDDARTGG